MTGCAKDSIHGDRFGPKHTKSVENRAETLGRRRRGRLPGTRQVFVVGKIAAERRPTGLILNGENSFTSRVFPDPLPFDLVFICRSELHEGGNVM